MDASVSSPDYFSPQLIQSTKEDVVKIVGKQHWMSLPGFDAAFNTHMTGNLSRIQHEGFKLPTKAEKINVNSLGAEFLAWAVGMSLHSETIATNIALSQLRYMMAQPNRGDLNLPKNDAEIKALITFYSDKIKSRSLGLLKNFVQLYSEVSGNQRDEDLLRLMKKGLVSHKALIISIYNEYTFGQPIPLGETLPFLFGQEEREKKLYKPNTQVFTDSVWELFEYMHIQREETNPVEVADAIDKFNNSSVRELQQGSETTDTNEELIRMKSHIDFFINRGLLPKPNKLQPTPITIYDYGPGFDRILKPRVEYLQSLGYQVEVRAIDVSEEVKKYQKSDKEPAVKFYRMLFSQTPLQKDLLGLGDMSNCDWGSIQHAWFLSEIMTSLQAMALCLKQGKPITLNVTVDSGKVEELKIQSIKEALEKMNIFYKPGTLYFAYPGQKEGVNIYIPLRELWMKLIRDVGINILNLRAAKLEPAYTGSPSPIYKAGDRERMDVIGTAGKVDQTDNVVALLLAFERFGGLAFPQMIKQESENA